MVEKVAAEEVEQVWNRVVKRTAGLKREDLFQDKYGNIKSKRASKNAKRNKNLVKAGYTTQEGKFGAVKIEDLKKEIFKEKISKEKFSKKSFKKPSSTEQKKQNNERRRQLYWYTRT